MSKYKQTNSDYEFDPQELQRLMDDYHAGKKDEANLYFVSALEGFINNEIRHFASMKSHCSSYELEDLHQEAVVAILKKVEQYKPILENGDFIRPSSFFGNDIRGVIYRGSMKDTITPHYAKSYKIISDACKKYGLEIVNDEVMIDKYSKITGLPTKTIREALNQHSSIEVVLDETCNESAKDWNPEKYIEDKIKVEKIANVKNSLKPHERYVATEILQYERLYKDVRADINNNLAAFGLEKPLTASELKEMVVALQQKLRYELREYAPKKYRPPVRLKKAETYYTKAKLESNKNILLDYLNDDEVQTAKTPQ